MPTLIALAIVPSSYIVTQFYACTNLSIRLHPRPTVKRLCWDHFLGTENFPLNLLCHKDLHVFWRSLNALRLCFHTKSSLIFQVKIHGWPDLAIGWRYQMPMLLELGYRVVCPDLIVSTLRQSQPLWLHG